MLARTIVLFCLMAAVMAPVGCVQGPETSSSRPNVVLIMTDDQGLGDFGFTGNPVIRTPNLDALASASARLSNFYVHPVCTPTRAALMTGRHPQRTRAFDTYLGRAMMDPDEVTVAEVLRDAGYATGIFGKWHLGDCYPMRAIDQGFDEALVHRGGGIGQPSDPPGGERKYTDAVLFHNGERVETEGYCTDVYFDAAIDWFGARSAAGEPFFAYIATNAPHGPFHDVPREKYQHYKSTDVSHGRMPQERGHPLPRKQNDDRVARVFAMIENIDDNVGKLVGALRESGQLENTIVIFLVDNGPNTRRYVCGFRGNKSSVYEGGIRSPLLAHWPDRLPAGVASDVPGAHYDLMPTILSMCDVDLPDHVEVDGIDLSRLLDRSATVLPEREIVIQAHRGDAPVRYHHCALRRGNWKLVNHSGFGKETRGDSVDPQFQLFDLAADPFEQVDVAADHPELVASLRAKYDAWFDDVLATRPDIGQPPPILIGAEADPGPVLTRQDWRRTSNDGGWTQHSMGRWLVEVVSAGRYDFSVRFLRNTKPQRVHLSIGDTRLDADVDGPEHRFEAVELPRGRDTVEVWVDAERGRQGAYQVVVRPSSD